MNPDTTSEPKGATETVSQPEPSETERLTLELEAARRRINELAHAIQAGERDREQFKERQNRERERMLDIEKGTIAQTLLDAVDQLDLCLASVDDSPLAQGVKLIRGSVLKQAEGLGIERVELIGKPFDPNFAEANDLVMTDQESQDGRVAAVVKAAYTLKGRVIRAGVVRVAKYVKHGKA